MNTFHKSSLSIIFAMFHICVKPVHVHILAHNVPSAGQLFTLSSAHPLAPALAVVISRTQCNLGCTILLSPQLPSWGFSATAGYFQEFTQPFQQRSKTGSVKKFTSHTKLGQCAMGNAG